MYIKYNSHYADSVILHIPSTCVWSIRYQAYNEKGFEAPNLYLNVTIVPNGADKEYKIADSDDYYAGRNIPLYEIGSFYEDVIESICKKIADNPNLHLIDVPKTESEILEQEYIQRWVEKGYINPDKNGHW